MSSKYLVHKYYFRRSSIAQLKIENFLIVKKRSFPNWVMSYIC